MATVVITFETTERERARIESALSGHRCMFAHGATDVRWAEADALLVFSFRDVPDAAFDEMRRLKVVQTITAGMDHVPRNRFQLGVIVQGAAGGNAAPVAEHAVAMLLCACRRLTRRATQMRGGVFAQDEDVLRIEGARVTVLGTGSVGRAIAARLAPFGCDLEGINRSGSAVPGFRATRAVDQLDRVLPETDALIVALPLGPQTEGMIDARRLALLPEHAVLVNVARARIVDERALFDHLSSNPRFTAALDVWWEYPPRGTTAWAPAVPWPGVENLVMTPHVAGTWPGFRGDMAVFAAGLLQKALATTGGRERP